MLAPYQDPERASALLTAATEAYAVGDHAARGRALEALAHLPRVASRPAPKLRAVRTVATKAKPPRAPVPPHEEPAVRAALARGDERARLMLSRPDLIRTIGGYLATSSLALVRAACATISKDGTIMTTTDDSITILTKQAFAARDAVTQDTALKALRHISAAEADACELRLRSMQLRLHAGGLRMINGSISVSARSSNARVR